MPEWLMQIGVGGVFAIVIIEKVFNFLVKNKTETDGNDFVKRQEFDRRGDMVQWKENCKLTIQRFDGLFLAQEKRFDKIDENLKEVKMLIKNGNKST